MKVGCMLGFEIVNETDSIDYVMAEVDADGNIVELNTIEDSEDSSRVSIFRA